MTQSLLAEKFKLITHRETRQGQVYKRVVAKRWTSVGSSATHSLAVVNERKGRRPTEIDRHHSTLPAGCATILKSQDNQELTSYKCQI